MFLKEFTGGLPWAHLDIAGTAWAEEAKPYLPKGPSGVAVRTLAELAFERFDAKALYAVRACAQALDRCIAALGLSLPSQAQPRRPIIVKIIEPPKSELTGLADVLLGSLGLTGVLVLARCWSRADLRRRAVLGPLAIRPVTSDHGSSDGTMTYRVIAPCSAR